VERAFERCRTEEEKTRTEATLKSIITEAIHAKVLWSRDWDRFPLPEPARSSASQAREREREKEKERKSHKDKEKGKGKSKQDGGKRARETDDEERLEMRAKRFQEKEENVPQASAQQRRRVAWRAFAEAAGGAVGGGGGGGGGEEDGVNWEALRIRGTSTALEKRYLRLTAPPDPATVRPEPVLREALAHLRRRWKAQPDYAFICEQLKSVRQDLTVQNIKTSLTVEVYETHARLALENGDLSEFNQCQTQLRELYREGLLGPQGHTARAEFAAYRLLYAICTDNRQDQARLLAELAKERHHPPIRHALDCLHALNLENYVRFFRLYANTPNMGGYLLDPVAEKLRQKVVRVLCKVYRPSLPVAWIAQQLAFDSPQECANFLRGIEGLQLSADGSELITKAS
jgi:hypothetical protein